MNLHELKELKNTIYIVTGTVVHKKYQLSCLIYPHTLMVNPLGVHPDSEMIVVDVNVVLVEVEVLVVVIQ